MDGTRLKTTKESFLVADRGIGLLPAAGSIAASWVWAPALFVSAEVAYKWGWQGLGWFLIPNVLVLVLFGLVAHKLRTKHPNGFTLSGTMRETHSPRVQKLYLFQLLALSTCSFAVQLIGGGHILSTLTGISFPVVAALLAATAVAYSIAGGIKASIFTDYAHMVITLLVVALLIPTTIITVDWSTITTGITTPATNISPLALALTFGIPTTIGLLAGPFGDQSFWQRAFATKQGTTAKAFTLGAGLFAVVPLCMSVLGFAASGAELGITDTQFVNFETVQQLLPSWATVPFVVMVVGCLLATIDSQTNAVGSIAGHDLATNNQVSVTTARVAMGIVAVTAVLIAQVPGITITHLFLIYGTLRAATVAPTVLTTLTNRTTETGVFYGIAAAFLVGLPIFIYGSFFTDNPAVKTIGSVVTITLAAVLAITPLPTKGQNK